MTEDDYDLMHEISDQYWIDLSKLIGRTLSKAPARLHDELLMRLQEKSSVYGSDYESHLLTEPLEIEDRELATAIMWRADELEKVNDAVGNRRIRHRISELVVRIRLLARDGNENAINGGNRNV